LDEDDAMQQASGIEEGPMMSRNSGDGCFGGSSSNSNNEMLREWNNHGPSSSSASGNHMSSSIPSDSYRSPSRRKPSSSIAMADKGTNVPPLPPPPPKQIQTWDDNDILIPFVESLEPGAGFQCLSLLLLNYLLQSEEGYDARIRACIKKLGAVILIHELKQSESECEEIQSKLGRDQTTTTKMGMTRNDILAKMATRKFESLEHTIASKLLRISAAQQQQHATKSATRGDDNQSRRQIRRENFIKGIKIGSAGVAAGALFAVTGGLAAPGIAAGLAATGLTTGAVTAGVVTTLTSTAAVTTIFGVGGGSLAAYKTHRRTKGVTEFEFQKQGKQAQNDSNENAELFSSICISGWIKDDKDFQRPWGVDPINPSITDRTERLARFYAVINPDNIPRCQEILKRWKGEERDLWALLRQKYGTDPDHLYPMYDSPHRKVVLTHEEDEIVDNLLGELGYNVPAAEVRHDGSFHRHTALEKRKMYEEEMRTRAANSSDISSSLNTSTSSLPSDSDQGKTTKKNLLSVWDYQIEYGGELLTVRWESDLLMELYDSVQDMAADLVGTAAREILKQTALSALITAVALPYGLVRAANMIDGTWTLAIERADLAGIELARSLLESQAGHRPVVLIGFSMGARTVYSCLKELARQQEVWESQQEELAREEAANKRDRRRFKPRLKRDQNKKKDQVQFLREPASIVEDAILMGLPNHLSLNSFEACRRIVAGRLVNCYSQKDLILSLMFQFHRLSGALRAVCGTSPVHVRGIENYDVSALVSAHSDYCNMTGHILRMIYHGCPHRSEATIVVPSEFSTEYSV
jgi:dienelactone hydrolase